MATVYVACVIEGPMIGTRVEEWCWPDFPIILWDVTIHAPTLQWRHKWARWRLKSPASQQFTQTFIQAQIKENITSPRRPVNSPHKGPVTPKLFPFDDVIMNYIRVRGSLRLFYVAKWKQLFNSNLIQRTGLIFCKLICILADKFAGFQQSYFRDYDVRRVPALVG